jgi:FkbM family methyltransferase
MAQPASHELAQAIRELQHMVRGCWKRIGRLSQRLAALEAASRLAAAGRAPRMPVDFRAQFGEDLFAWELLGNAIDGFFIEVGAFDGYELSVTYALEAMGWNGLLIEGNPERAEQCRQRRPNSRVVHAALGMPGGPSEATFHIVQDHHGGMLSGMELGQEELRKIKAEGFAIKDVRVPRTTMNALLEGHTGPIDLAVIDVEGGELDLLRGFDLAKHRPRVLFIEDNTPGGDQRLDNYMAGQPYQFCGWIEMNRLYVHNDDAATLALARRL